ncbi:hypothetical protein NQ318_013013 [Aromia moschata]|uniref:Uncharacterized protein n=1 Tax=Aromia moschata TaxID=1265417 RepID=A0AAV8XYD9_9CUCU|nr:hypothetical protein NQ318_013013 [Aromia moschata]
MEDVKEKSIHHTTIKICEDLKKSPAFLSLYEDIQKLVVTPSVKSDDFKYTLLKAMQDNGLESELKKQHLQMGKNEEKGCQPVDIHKYRPVYAPKDFLEVLLNLKGPIKDKSQGDSSQWEFTQLPLKVKNLAELIVKLHKQCYRLITCTNNTTTDYLRGVSIQELSRGEHILAASNSLNTTQSFAAFEAERIVLGEKILTKNYAPLAQEFLKRVALDVLGREYGVSLLGAEVKPLHKNYFEMLREHVLQYDLMTDKLIIKDINLTASNDDQYFVFEDVLYQVMLCFSRDAEILKSLPNQPAFMQVVIKGKQNGADNTMVFPPSGVIPFHGFTMYVRKFVLQRRARYYRTSMIVKV